MGAAATHDASQGGTEYRARTVRCGVDRSCLRLRSVQTTDLNMFEIGDGHIPDLIVMHAAVLTEARETKAKHL
jgi:hypothetical protein